MVAVHLLGGHDEEELPEVGGGPLHGLDYSSGILCCCVVDASQVLYDGNFQVLFKLNYF